MMLVVVLLTLVAPGLSQNYTTPTSPTGLPSSAKSNSCENAVGDGGSGQDICKNVTTINRPASVIFTEQPVYFFMFSKDPKFTRVDNVCITLFPLPDSPETFRAYLSWTYIDGSTLLESFIIKSYERGANFWTTTTRGFLQYNMGYIGCGAYIRYSCPKYGNAAAPFLLGFGPGVGPVGNGTGKLTDECAQKALSIAKDNGLNLEDIYLPPYNLPTNCVYRQVCLPNNNSLSCQQDNSCQDNTT